MADTVYANGILIKKREVTFPSGDTSDVMKLSIQVEDFTKFLKDHKNDRGWISIDLKERKSPSDKGHTHYAVLDTWEPNGSDEKPATKTTKTPVKQKNKPAAPQPEDDDSDIPF